MDLVVECPLVGLTPQMVLALGVAGHVFRRHGYQARLTSLAMGEHKRASLHYVGLAADLGFAAVPADVRGEIADEVAGRLGPEFDTVLSENCLHIEWQPKSGSGVVHD